MSDSTHERPLAPADRHHAETVARIQDALRDLRFGSVTVVVQDGIAVQVERTEKLRLPRSTP